MTKMKQPNDEATKGGVKKKRLTSWQRRKGPKTAGGGEEAALNLAIAAAKAMSQEARDRWRQHVPLESGDAELIEAYRQATAEFHAFKPPAAAPSSEMVPTAAAVGTPKAAAVGATKTAAMGAPKAAAVGAPKAAAVGAPKAAAVGAPTSEKTIGLTSSKPRSKASMPSHDGAESHSLLTREALGCQSAADRRLAKKKLKTKARSRKSGHK